MAKRRQKALEDIYTLISVRVESHDVDVDASINYDVRQPQYAYDLHDDDPLFKYVTRLTIVGTSSYPEGRANERYEVTVYGDDAPSRSVFAKVKDAHARDEYGAPQYRQYRGKRVPVYQPPMGFGLLNKVRGEQTWNAWLNLAPRIVTDMLVLLNLHRQLYLAIQERKVGRTRWVYSISLQTRDPAEE